jgi:excinuclease ABC subunit A
VNGDVLDITPGMKLDRYKTHDIEIVVDRMVIENTSEKRKHASTPCIMEKMYYGFRSKILRKYFSRNLMCPTTGISYQNPEPNLFSFNSPKGACDHCKGLGR